MDDIDTESSYIAICVWFWRNSADEWKPLTEPAPAICRATVGKKLVTVSLPEGRYVRCHLRHDIPITMQIFCRMLDISRRFMVKFMLQKVDECPPASTQPV